MVGHIQELVVKVVGVVEVVIFTLLKVQQKGGEEIYEYCVENCIGNMKAKILFILEDNWILKIFFKGYITETYDKKYEKKQKKTKHVLIFNMK